MPPYVRQSLLQNYVSGDAPHWREVSSFISLSLNCILLRKLLHLGYWPLYLPICNSNYLYVVSFACHTLFKTPHTGGTICTGTCCCAVPRRECSCGGRGDSWSTCVALIKAGFPLSVPASGCSSAQLSSLLSTAPLFHVMWWNVCLTAPLEEHLLLKSSKLSVAPEPKNYITIPLDIWMKNLPCVIVLALFSHLSY